jgi:hypothetical protein
MSKKPNYLKEQFSPRLRNFARTLVDPLPTGISYGHPPPTIGALSPFAQSTEVLHTPHVYGQFMPQPMPQTLSQILSYPPDLPYKYPSPVPVPSMQTVPLNSLARGSTYAGPFGLSNAKIPKLPNARRILPGVYDGPRERYSPFPPPGGQTTYPGLFSTVNPVTGEIKYYVKGGRKTRARRKKRSKTRRH